MTALENVNPGAIIFCPSKNSLGVVDGYYMEDRWFRVTCDFVMNLEHHIYFGASGSSGMPWLSQANHVFSRLGITSNFEDYVPYWTFNVIKMTRMSGHWSLHPSGIERLSWEDAASLGFPRIGILEYALGYSWDSSFHRAKGFDPDSQELALHLGEPLYELSSQTNPPFAHFHEEEHSAGGGYVESAPHMHNGPGNSEVESQVILESTHPNGGNTSLDEDSEISVSNTFKFVLNVQLALILFHMLLWLVGWLA
ncbi:hypothetical protein B0H14DRAFT_2946973 [Mycena olivaceomarginata]|nr:hypothetical protein B0H14DRAFT_3020597 [Mycena olivaceomarginata]KAJ7788826.1 hypothetical protein B0H14DRAFT_2946973 [Mycena olivaceomarginata]